MSAENKLSGPQFLHGSPHLFSGQVEPTGLLGHIEPGDHDPHNRAYFTTDRETAKAYARSSGQSAGYIYHVHPQGEYEHDPYEQSAYRSAHPLTVLGREEISTEPDLIPDAAKAKLKAALDGMEREA